MAHDVVVALVGTTDYFERFPPEERTRLYADRPKATLRVDDDELMEQVIRRARPELGIDESMSLGYIGFYRPEDDDGLTGFVSDVVTLVDDDGRALWGTWWGDVPFREIVRSAEAGVLGGDAFRPYTALKAPIGNGMLPEWQHIQTFLQVTQDVVKAMADLGGAVALLELLRRRLTRAPETIERNAGQWMRRGGSPHRIVQWLDRRPWHLDDVTAALNCSPEEAEVLLWCFGFARAESGLFRRREDGVATALSETMKTAISGRIYDLSRGEMDDLVRQAAEQLQREGQVPETDESGWPWYS